MKIINLLVTLFILTVSVIGHPSDRLPSAKDLVTAARASRAQALDSILLLKENINQLRTPQEFEEYFYILPELNNLAIKFRLNEVYPDAVSKLGEDLVAHGKRWFKLGQESQEKLKYYLQWMSLNVALDFLEQVKYEITLIESQTEFKNAAKNLELFYYWSIENHPKDLYLTPGVAKTSSSLALKALQNESDVDLFWINHLRVQSDFFDYLVYFNRLMLKKNMKAEELDKYLEVLLQLAQVADELPEASGSIFVFLGDSLADLLIYYLQNERPLEIEKIKRALTHMESSSLRGLTFKVLNSPKIINEKYVDSVHDFIIALLEASRNLNLFDQVTILQSYLKKDLAAVYSSKLKHEGTYLLKDNNGNDWNLTLARAKENQILAALSDKPGFVNFSFFNVEFDALKGLYVASEVDPDVDRNRNYTVQFIISDKGDIELELLFSFKGVTTLKGFRVDTFPNLLEDYIKGKLNLAKQYVGTLELPEQNSVKVNLRISPLSDRYIARMANEKSTIVMDFQLSTKVDGNVIYLTTSRNARGSWLQLRLKYDGGLLVGHSVLGGRGRSQKEVIFFPLNVGKE